MIACQFSVYAQQNFEGILTYKIKIQDKIGKMTDEQSEQFMGTTNTYYLKGKKYKSELNSLLKVTTYHEGKDTLFTKIKGSNTLMYTLTNIEKETVISHNLKK